MLGMATWARIGNLCLCTGFAIDIVIDGAVAVIYGVPKVAVLAAVGIDVAVGHFLRILSIDSEGILVVFDCALCCEADRATQEQDREVCFHTSIC